MPRPKSFRRLRAALPFALAVATALPMLGDGSAAADPIDDQRQRVQELTDQLQQLEEDADKFGEQVNVALIEQQELTADIGETENRIARKQAKVDKLSDDLADVAADAFVSSGSGNLGPLFRSADQHRLTEQRNEYSRVALNLGSVTTDDLDAAIDDLDTERATLEEQKDEVEQLKNTAADAKEQAEASKREYQQLRTDAETELGQLIKEEEERRAREAYEKMLAEQERQAEELRQQQEAERQRQEEERRQQLAEAEASQEAAEATTATQVADDDVDVDPVIASDDGDGDGDSGDSGDGDSGDGGDGDSNGDRGGGGGTAPVPYSPPAPEPPPPAVPGSSAKAQIAINAALSEVGTPWVFAMAQPGVGFDCSGLTSWAWGRAGVSMPHQSAQQYASLPHVPLSQARPGDLIFYYSPISHVGIYLGNGQQVHSPNSTTNVKVAPVNWSNAVGAARPG